MCLQSFDIDILYQDTGNLLGSAQPYLLMSLFLRSFHVSPMQNVGKPYPPVNKVYHNRRLEILR